MKILLPLDLVQPVEPIVNALAGLVDLATADVKLLYVHEILPAYENALRTSGQFSDDWEKQYDATATAKLKEAEALLRGKCKAVSSELANGPTAMTIENIAKNERHDLTVVAARDKHNKPFFGGSISNKVLHHAPGAVLLLRGRNATLRHVVIGYDGSKNARHAITKATEMFKLADSNTKVALVHAVDLAEPVKLLGPVEFVSSLEQNALMQGEAFLAEAEKTLAAGGVKNIDLHLIEDDPASGVITMAKESSADLVIIGAQGHTAVEHFLLGSVSHKIATHVPCSVAVIKPTAH